VRKNLSFPKTFFPAILFFSIPAAAQITVVSSNGYVVDINVQPVAILPASSSCAWGYNYNVKLNYLVTFAGSNKPAALYTLQGTIGCNPATSFFDLPNTGGSGSVTAANAWRGLSDCSTSTPSSLACNTVNIEISGPGISSRTISYAVTFTPLPVTLLSFEAAAEKNRVKLNWSTASETNNDHFIVERSIKANEWIDIEKIKGAINSSVTQNYTYCDVFSAGGTVYYRLKQVDLDGHINFSRVVSVDFHQQGSVLNVYPVPNRGNTIGINGVSDYKNYELTITDINERIVYSTTSVTASMYLPELKPGIYMMRFTNRNTNESSTTRYVKL